MSTATQITPIPSSMDLRETARRLAMLEADGIPSEDCARAVANVASWLRVMAAAQDDFAARMIVSRVLGRPV